MNTLPPPLRLAVALAVALAPPARAQGPAPPAPVNPQAPALAVPVPLGMQRGTALELTLTGTNLAGPTRFWTSFPARVAIPTDHDNGKDNAKLRVRLEVPKGAPLGYHTIRLATTRGVSNFRLFCIDDLPQLLSTHKNRSPAAAQPLAVPAVVVGKADAEVSDYYKVTVKAGQRLSFDVLGRRLGSTFDPQLTLYDARTGRELPDGHSNDAPGCQTDPRLTYTFKEAGDYLVEVRDVMYRGGPDYWYRLRVGDFPCATTPVPMAARRGTRVKVHFAGPNVADAKPVEVRVPTDPAVDTIWVAPKGKGGPHGWPVALAVSDHEELLEKEPNDQPARANRVPVPGGVTGRFEKKGDVDCFAFTAKKGRHYVIAVETHELHSPTEVYLTVRDGKGTQLAAANPAAAPRIDFAAPADGDFVVTVEHLLYWFGPAETYHLTVTPAAPDFSLAAGGDRYDVPQGLGAPVNLLAVRRGYAGPIEVSVVGPKGLRGRVTIPAGAATGPPQPATLSLKAAPDLARGAYPVVLRGEATIDGKRVVRYASVANAVRAGLNNLPFPPRHLLHQVVVGVVEPPPFTLAAKLDPPEAVRGLPAHLSVTATRSAGFTEEIALSFAGLPPGVAAVAKNIPKGQTRVKVALNAAANAPLGRFLVTCTGKARHQNREFTSAAPPVALPLVLPFDLKAEPAPLQLTAGAKAKLKVTAVRKGGYAGPVALQLRNLPANVTAAPATIAAGQTAAEVEVTAAVNAAAGDKAGVNVLGTAPAAGNQQNASANFVVRVLKK